MYFTLMLFTFMFVLVDTGLQYLNIYINKWYVAQKEKSVRDRAQKAKHSKSVIRRKVTVYNSKYRICYRRISLTHLFMCDRSRFRILAGGGK